MNALVARHIGRKMRQSGTYKPFVSRIYTMFISVLSKRDKMMMNTEIAIAPEEIKFTGATLLSVEEYETYKDNIASLDDWWWLRSSGSEAGYVADVYDSGDSYMLGSNICSSDIAVRPAITFDHDKSKLLIGDKVLIDNVTFTVIADGIMLANEAIGMHCFRKDWNAPDANDYEASDIKNYVDEWFKRNLGPDKCDSPFPETHIKKKIFPNDPCPCGSGKKYKKCCWKKIKN